MFFYRRIQTLLWHMSVLLFAHSWVANRVGCVWSEDTETYFLRYDETSTCMNLLAVLLRDEDHVEVAYQLPATSSRPA